MNDNPYSSPQVETAQVESDLVLGKPSWAVHWVAMISLGFGALTSVFAFMVIADCFVTWKRISNYPEYDYQAKSFDEMNLQLLIVIAASVLVLAFCLIASGHGIWRRKQWARILSIILGTLAILFGLWLSVMAVNELLLGSPEALIGCVLPVCLLFYGAFVLSIFQRNKFKAEFIGTVPAINEADA